MYKIDMLCNFDNKICLFTSCPLLLNGLTYPAHAKLNFADTSNKNCARF